MDIVLVGSGNVATVLGRRLLGAGHVITQVFSRNAGHAATLAAMLRSAAVTSVKEIVATADIYIFAISDDELEKVHEWGFSSQQVVVHTAGSVSREALKAISPRYGVLYPLQTLRKEKDPVNDIPFLIDGNVTSVSEEIFALASSVSKDVRYAGDEERARLHLAAVMVNNFSNHLYTLAASYCASAGADFGVLYPLILEGAMRLKDSSPAAMQTGPAIRNDQQTIARQREKLRNYPELLQVYDVFTKSILGTRP